MAVAKTARIARSLVIGEETKLLDLSLTSGEGLGFAGGQYVIVDSGIPLPGGKIAKRAYSIVSSDTEQGRFELAVRRIAEGPGSSYMHDLAEGAEVRFSGPWGKFVVPTAIEPAPCLVIATDTGITAALGLVQAAAFRPWLARTTLVWCVESPDYFVPESFVRSRSPEACALVIERVPPTRHPERVPALLALLGRMLEGGTPESAYLSGDGDLLYPACDELRRAGVAEGRVFVECFFNNPARKAA